ncbi:hypothetical protein EVAR_12944_1 [Eumeta japonica]|uniref:Uncharacterized protein n=1 Tax=Eumeta variegata TaxID=151549 RepID=A0A4C1TVV5_EUMVA|nr:hypothetical protein EVAR_12944_1 [Eumeta japonica]
MRLLGIRKNETGSGTDRYFFNYFNFGSLNRRKEVAASFYPNVSLSHALDCAVRNVKLSSLRSSLFARQNALLELHAQFAIMRGKKLKRLKDKLDFDIIVPSTSIYFLGDLSNRPFTLDITIIKGVAIYVGRIETLHCLDSDYFPVLLRIGTTTGGSPYSTINFTNWNRASIVLEKIDTPSVNSISDQDNGGEQRADSTGVLGPPGVASRCFRIDKSKKRSFASRESICCCRI